MSNLPELSHPVFFLLALPLGVLVVFLSLRHLRVSSRVRLWAIGALRMVLVLVLLVYLAGPRRTVTESETQRTTVLLDTSYSIPGPTWSRTLEQVVRSRGDRSSSDPMSVFLFGEMYEGALRYDGGDGSNPPADGIKQGRASLDETVLKRINPYRSRIRTVTGDVAALSGGERQNRTIVLTDGYAHPDATETEEWTPDVLTQDVTVVPVKGGYDKNVSVKDVSAPTRVRAGEPVSVDVTVSGPAGTDLRLAVKFGEKRTEETEVRLADGEPETVQVGPVLPYAGSPPDEKEFVEIEATLMDHSDPVSVDNQARTGMVVYPPLRVLSLSTGEQPGAVERAMRAQELDVERMQEPTRDDLAKRLSDVDLVLINSPPRAWANRELEEPIRTFVRTNGGGVLAIPGTGSRARTWLRDTRLAPLLPVQPLPRDEPTSPEPEEQETSDDQSGSEPDKEGEPTVKKGDVARISLMLVIDTSGSMTGKKIGLVKEAAIATIETLDEKDRIGVLAFDHRQRWITHPIQANRTSTFKKRIAKLKAGGRTKIVPALQVAGRALRTEDAAIKHLILLSDGAGELADYKSVVKKLRGEGITISTVAAGEEVHLLPMLNIAEWGGGQVHEPKNFSEVPQIFTREAKAVVNAFEEREEQKNTEERPPESLPAAGRETDDKGGSEKETASNTSPAEPMTVRQKDAAPFLDGLDSSDLPDVQRILPATSGRFSFVSLEAGSDPARPFVGYRYSGTGMTGVILSGMNREDAPGWVKWDSFPQFVAQITRFLARNRAPELFQPSFEVQRKPGLPVITLNVSIPTLKRKERSVDDLRLSWRGGKKSDWNRTELERVSNHEFQARIVGSRPGTFAAFRLNVKLKDGREFIGYHAAPSTVPREFETKGINRTFLEQLRDEGVTVEEDLQEVLRASTSYEKRKKQPFPHWPLTLLSIVILVDIYLMKVG